MKLTDALLGEHAVLYELFDFVRDTIAKSDDFKVLRGVVTVLERLLISHAKAEDALLFPALEPHLGKSGPLAVMRAEHSQIAELLEAAWKAESAEDLKSAILRLLNLADEHFHKEEQVLFVLAQQAIDDESLTSLGGEWAAMRHVTIDGQGCGA